MSPEGGEGDWHVDTEGNLTGPGEAQPGTDEFGRTDPAALERERRRREREQRRDGQRSRADAKRSARAPTAEQAAAPSAAERAPRLPRRKPRGAAREGAGAPPKPPRARPTRAGGGHFRRRRIVALAAALIGILLVWFLIAFFQPFAGGGEGEGSVTVEIPQGASAGDIAKILDDAGVVSSARLFEWRLSLSGKSEDIQADTYTLASGMSYGAAIDALTSAAGPAGPITVSIPEGYDRTQIADLVLPEGVSSDEYLRLTESAPKGFDPRRYGASSDSLEGFLFPATYELPADEAQRVPSLVDQQLQAFRDNVSRVDMGYARKKNLTVYDVLIIASMVDKEVLVPKERPLVAAVIYNRLSQGMALGIDATTRYETGNYTEQIQQSDLDADTPYNTRTNIGLTPTPIGNPGLAALKAAANPARVPYTFFVVKPGTCGEHSFTASEAEFKRLAADYQAALDAEGGSPTDCE